MTAKDLKAALLQEAVQGKLVPQIESEGNARDLLEQIRMPHGLDFANAKSNSKKSRTKKETALAVSNPCGNISDDEKPCLPTGRPFDIPQSWCWCRFSEIFEIINGDRGKNYPAKSTLSHKGIPFISALNLQNNSVKKDENLLCLTDVQYEKLGNGKLKKGDMVVCIRGSLGKHGIFPFEKGAIASSLVIVRTYVENPILCNFLNLYLDAPIFLSEIKKYDNGTAQPNLAAESLKKFLFPLPPLAEQKRIVSALEKILPLCEKLGK